jgi:alkanesulfonate monooxygenase SsuD/methylene tetrahydromethanopterin reductase-like flavin-dependent oxidoreductase (luciferase family)
MATACELGLQFHLASTVGKYSTRDFTDLSALAQDRGFSQIWVTDNLGVRNPFVVLAAIAGHIQIKLGIGVMVQYFRNPVDVADAVATLSELMEERELSIGLARGSLSKTPRYVRQSTPLAMLHETAQILRHLLDGDEVTFAGYPALAAYFNFAEDGRAALSIRPQGPVRLYGGGNGPRALAIAGETMDGIIYGGSFLAAMHGGAIPGALDAADRAARAGSNSKLLRKVAEINVSLSRDKHAARHYARPFAATVVTHLHRSGYAAAEFRRLGIRAQDVARLVSANHADDDRIPCLVTDAMVDATIIAGDAAECRPRLRQACAAAAQYGFQQVMFSKIGPDYREGIMLLADALG